MKFESYKQDMSNDAKNMNYDTPAMDYNYKADSCCGGMMDYPSQMGGCAMPVYECPRENVCHRYICYEVPHV